MTRRTLVLAAILFFAMAWLGYRQWTNRVVHVPAWQPVEGFIREIPEAVRLRHEYHLHWIRKGPLDMVFFGDSIARGWEDYEDLWEKHFGSRRCGLFATSHDTTSNLLWRLDHGELDGYTPRLVVVLIGTNNRKDTVQTAEEIAKGIETILARIRSQQPQARVLLLGILPQGYSPRDPGRDLFRRVNQIVETLSDGKTVFYRDYGPALLEPDGRLSPEISPDGTHLTRKGYERWAEAMEPDLKQLFGN